MREESVYEVYYDKEGDFLEVSFGESAKDGTTEEIEQGIFVTRDVEADRVTDIGILNFRQRVEILGKILERLNLKVPLKIEIDD